MKILIIGNGGREHAIAWRLKHSKTDVELYTFGTNAGINSIANHYDVDENDFHRVAEFCFREVIDLVVVGPEAPLAKGIANELRSAGINVFGPSKEAAKIESSKAFAKNFMSKYKIPTAAYRVFSKEQENEAIEYINSLDTPIVLKADGLAAGKGVVVCEKKQTAIETLRQMFSGLFGKAGETVVIEEFLEGDEASVLAITDGVDYIILPSSQDHKRIFDGDKGKNTGGMGAYAPTPLVDSETMEFVQTKIIEPTIAGLNNEGTPFVGCLYAGLMIKDKKAKVVEYNCRFGDPETQAILPLIGGDFPQLLYHTSKGKIEKELYVSLDSHKYSCCVVIASEGYPDSYEKGFEISGIRKAESIGCIVFHAGTKKVGDRIVTDGGRVLSVCALGNTLEQAIEQAYRGVEFIEFQNKYYRKDIGQKGLKYLTRKV